MSEEPRSALSGERDARVTRRALPILAALLLVVTAFAGPAAAVAGRFNPPHADRGVDTDGDGLYNRLDVDVHLTITSGGLFLLTGVLYAPDNTLIATASKSANLPVGNATVTLRYIGMDLANAGKDGPYTVALTLYDASFNVLATDTYMTKAYAASDFQPPAATLDPPHADRGLDLDGNGRYDLLAVDVRLNVNTSGGVRLKGNLYDGGDTIQIDSKSVTSTLAPGVRTVPLDFTGYLISRFQVDGPYLVKLWLYDATGALMSQGTHVTGTYTWGQFEVPPATLAPPHADAGIDFDGNGKYDYLRLAVHLNVVRAGTFTVFAELWEDKALNPAFLGYTQNTSALPTGAVTVHLYFVGDAIRVAGIFNALVAHLEVSDAAGIVTSTGDYTTVTRYRSSDFDPLPAVFAPPHADRGLDLDGDGRYDELVVDASISVRLAFPYRVVGRLWNGGQTNLIATTANATTFAAGARHVPLWFDGRQIVNGSLPGPYVAALQLFDPFANLLNASAHTTQAYALSAFDRWDVTPPTIADARADPDPQEVFGVVTVSAAIVDDTAVASAWLDVAGVTNATMVFDPGAGRYARARPYGAVGTYAYVIWASDPNGNWASATGTIVIVDTTPPTITDVRAEPQSQEVFGVVNVSAAIADNVAVRAAWVDVAAVGNVTMRRDAGTGRYFLARAYGAPGTLPFTIWAADDAGNWGSATGSILLVDTTPPTIGDVRVDPPEQAPGSPVNVSAAIADAVGLAATRIQVRDPSGTLLVDAPFAADPATGRFFYARTYAAVGPYAVLLIADDAAGNEARANASFTVALTPDVTPPTIASHRATPDPQEPFGTVRIEASVTDDRAVASVSVLVVSPSGADVENATMAFDSTVYHHEAAYGETGAYTYCLWAVDGAGNGARACGGFTIRDTTPPTIANVSATPDPVELGGTVLVSARASDLVGVAAVTVAIRDPLGSLLGTFPMAVAGDVYTYAFAPAALGTFAYILTAADGSGNRATVAGAFLVRDTTPPAISAAASPDPQEIHVSVRFAAAVSDLDGVSSVAVEVRDPAGALLGPFAMAPDGPGRFAASRAFEDLGTYAFTVRAADPSGNAAAASGTFLVQDTTPPLAVAGPDVTVAFGDAVTFDGSASSDNDAIASYAWTFVDGPRDVALDGPVATYVFRNAGAVVVTLTVRDRAGNVASDGLVVTVTAPPSPGIAPPEAPRGLTATASSPTSLRLAWDPVTARTDGAPLTPAGYHVYRNATGSVLWEHITTTPVTGTTFVDAGLVRGIAYRYAVTALDAAGRESAPSVEASAVLPRPGGIRGVVADEASTPLPGAEVDLLRDGAMVATVRSADGRFAFPGVEPGPYTVRASRAGYASRDVPTLVDEGRWTELGAIRLAKTPVPPGPWWSFLAMPWFWVLVVAVALVGLAAESRRRLRRSRRERARRAKTRRTAAGGHQRTHFVSKGPKR